MHLPGYCVLMVQYIYISAQERDAAGTSGVLMGGCNNYSSSGLVQLLHWVYCDRKMSWLSRVPTHIWQVILVSDCSHGYTRLGI